MYMYAQKIGAKRIIHAHNNIRGVEYRSDEN